MYIPSHEYITGSEKMPDTKPTNHIELNGDDNYMSNISMSRDVEIQYNYYNGCNQSDSQIRQVITDKGAWRLNSDFLPRDKEIEDVKEKVRKKSSGILQIRGIGGFGKTALCCQLFDNYFNTKSDGIQHLGWIPFSGDLKSSIQGTIVSDNVNAKDPEEYFKQAGRLFNSLGESLLLFIDNADDMSDEDLDFLQTRTCRVILTARYKIEGTDEYILPHLPPEDCMELYRKLSNDNKNEDEAAIAEILVLSGYHTQTISLLAKTQGECGFTAQELLAELKEKGFSLNGLEACVTSNKPGDHFEASFIEHMQKLFDIAKIKDEGQLNALKLFSLLAPNHPLKRKTANKWFGQKNIKKLIERGWLNEYDSGDVYIHPVIAQTVKCSEPIELKNAYKLLYDLIDALDESQWKSLYVQRAIIAHAVSAAEYFNKSQDIKFGTLCNAIGLIYDELADYDKALGYYEKALHIHEKVLGTEHRNTAATYNNIAIVYKATGDYDKALGYYEKALEIYKKVIGTEHPYTAATYNNIAIVYYYKGDYEKALEYLEKALHIREKVLGTEHRNTANTYNNIANVYIATGDYDKALGYLEKDLHIREKVLEVEHPSTAITYNNIAIVYKATGDYDKALKYYDKILNIREKVLGTEHPDTANTYNGIACVYDDMGDYDKARYYANKAVKILKNKFGENHPVFINAKQTLEEIEKDAQKELEEGDK